MANHLIIGLGGTGGKILAGLRKRIYAETGKKDYTGSTTLDYLYVDSSEEDLNNKSDWAYMGTPLHLAPEQKVSIHGMGAGILENTHNYPGIEAFLPDKDRQLLYNDQVMSIISAGIGGQRRRFGRMLIANNIGTRDQMTSFVDRLRAKALSLTGNGDGTINFHVCAGLAGGTGSGSIVDVIAQLNKVTSGMTADACKIYLYLYIPEILVPADHDSGFYHANGFAALSELNAISLGVYNPVDVSGELDVNTGKVQKLLCNGSSFASAYLFSNINEVSRVLQKGEKLSTAVADFLFQKIIASSLVSSGKMARLETAENDGAAPEKDAAGQNVHSKNFLSFGIKRIEYPETEIKEYVTYNYAIQAARQLEYNTWIDGKGYDTITIEEVGLGYQADLKLKETRERLKLSDAYLTLQVPIRDIKGVTDNWQDFTQYWETVCNFFAAESTDDPEKRNWPSNFLDACETEFYSNFRGIGVKKFFETQRSEARGYSAYLRRHIEEILFNEWLSGEKSLLEVEKYITLLIDNCNDRLKDLDNKIASNRSYIEDEINPALADIEYEWDNIGWLKDAITGASRKVFDKYKAKKCEYYTVTTETEAFGFAKVLVQEVIRQLNSMLVNVTDFKTVLNAVLKKVNDEAESKCKVQSILKANEVNVLDKRYNPELIRELTKGFVCDSNAQKSNSLQVREALASFLSADEKNFGLLYNSLSDIDTLVQAILGVCNRNAVSMMENMAEKDPTMKMLKVNILEKIKQECNTEELLEQYIQNIVNDTKVFTQFNAEEMGKVVAGQTVARMGRTVQLCIPEYNDPSNFRDRFIKKFAEQCPGFVPSVDAVTNYRSSQIVVIAVASAFPLRYLQNIKFLEDKYKKLTLGNMGELNKCLLHTESFARPLPPLFEASVMERENERRPYAIIVHSLDVLKEKTDPETGASFLGLEIGSGFSKKTTALGKNMEETLKILVRDEVTNRTVTQYVDDLLNTAYRTNDARAKLRADIENAVCDTILPMCGNNDLDPLFVKYRKSAEELFETRLADR